MHLTNVVIALTTLIAFVGEEESRLGRKRPPNGAHQTGSFAYPGTGALLLSRVFACWRPFALAASNIVARFHFPANDTKAGRYDDLICIRIASMQIGHRSVLSTMSPLLTIKEQGKSLKADGTRLRGERNAAQVFTFTATGRRRTCEAECDESRGERETRR